MNDSRLWLPQRWHRQPQFPLGKGSMPSSSPMVRARVGVRVRVNVNTLISGQGGNKYRVI